MYSALIRDPDYLSSDQKRDKVTEGAGAETRGKVIYNKLQIGFYWVSAEPSRGSE